MRKFYIGLLFLLFSIQLVKSESLSTALAVDGKNRTVISTNTAQEWADEVADRQLDNTLTNNFMALQPYTSAAFTVYVTSDVASAVTCIFTVNKSSITTELRTKLSGGTTVYYYYDLTLSTSDSTQDLVDRIDSQPNWVATLSQGCYENELTTGTFSTRYDTEGKEEGLQFNLNADKTLSFSTGSANAVTIYLNAITKLSYRKSETVGKSYVYGTIDGNIAFPTGSPTITIYEGSISTKCTTQKSSPYSIVTTNVYFKNTWDVDFPIVTTSGYANKYEISNSSWITAGYFGIIGQSLSR